MPVRGQKEDGVCDGNTAEMTSCLVEHYKKVDAELNAIYQKSLKSATVCGSGDVAKLREVQRKWMSYRDVACEAELSLYHSGTAGGPARYACLWRITDQRKQDLTNAYLSR